ncbi:MAG: 2-carboxy-1,4-naphthoquinone phytyltransferase [Synechocystis sp.]|nr:2-carboxy-1,4-naphthoquinone phytyltransferase [Synechocystis sp.]
MTDSSVAVAPLSRRKLWLAAIKPPMYSVAVIPITVGSSVAFAHTEQWRGGVFALFLSAAIAIIAWINLSNDVFDSDTGIDVNKAHSVVNLTGKRNLVFWISNGFLMLGLGEILGIAWLEQDWTVPALIAVAVFLGYTYQGPPFRFGYLGLGEIICFITFGPLAIAAACYAQCQQFTTDLIAPSVFIGISTSIILFCSHFHQVADDRAAGKQSPIVRLGTQRGATVLAIAVACLYVTIGVGVALTLMPWQTLLALASLPWAIQLVNHVNQYHDQPTKVSNCKFIAVNLHFISGALLAIGYGLAGSHWGLEGARATARSLIG